MAVKILHKRSAVQFKNATGAQLEFGELGLNYNESGPYLQCKDANGEVIVLGGIYFSSPSGEAPLNPLAGRLWLRDDTLFIYDGENWIGIAGGSGGGGGGVTIIGGDGIVVTEVGSTVTIDADLDQNGLRFLNSKIALNIGDGLKFDNTKLVADWSDLPAGDDLIWDGNKWEVDWSEFPGGPTIDWDGTNWDVDWSELPTDNTIDWNGNEWGVDWSELPTDNTIDWDGNEWGVDWDEIPWNEIPWNEIPWDDFPGGKFLEYDNGDDVWNVTSIVSQDNAPDYEEDKLWYETDTGNLYVGYDDYWIRVNTPGKDGDPVVISQDTPPPFQEDAIWFDTSTGEAYFGYKDPSGSEYWVSLVKPGKDGDPVVISQDNAPPYQEDAIWFKTDTAQTFFGYDDYWVEIIGKSGINTMVVSEDPPTSPLDGQTWHSTANGKAYVYWEHQGVWVST